MRMGSLNVGTLTGERGELADLMERRRLNILCVQERKWQRNKARLIGGRFKLFYHGMDGRRNGVGVVVKEKYINSVMEVRRMSDRIMSVKMEMEGVWMNAISA